MGSSCVVLEFNELCPKLMSDFIDKGHLPNFAKLRAESLNYITTAEADPPNLEPWIQWVTVHTGLPYEEHGIFDLDDGARLEKPRLWDLVSRAGQSVWVCGSMNANADDDLNGYVLPDPWTTKLRPYPTGEFDAYFDFVSRYVQEYTRDRVPVGISDKARFAQFMMARGLSRRTVMRIIGQLFDERKGKNKWKRAVVLDRLQWDVFKWYWRKYRPNYATFFLNSTAHFQHMYWRNLDPTPFEIKPSPEDQAEYGDAVLFGYQQMDIIVGECLKLAKKDVAIILCTALSQQPCLKYEHTGGKVFHRVNDAARLLNFAGFQKEFRYAPVMSEQFRIYLKSGAEAEEAFIALSSLSSDGAPVMMARREGREVFAGCNLFRKLSGDATLLSRQTGRTCLFREHFYLVEGVKSGMHHPDGIFWVRKPGGQDQQEERRITLTRVAPTILSLCDVPKPEFMRFQALEEIRNDLKRPLIRSMHA